MELDHTARVVLTSVIDWISHGIAAASPWQWIERASWLVAVVGLPIGIYQVAALRREQKRVAQELSRKPKILIGFFPITGEHGKKAMPHQVDVTATWPPGAALSNPVEITLVCHNDGDRSAYQLLYNFNFPAGFEYLAAIQQGPRQGRYALNPETGRAFWSIRDEHLHPDDSSLFTTALAIPTRLPVVSIAAEVSMADRPTIKAELQLRVIVHAPAIPVGPGARPRS